MESTALQIGSRVHVTSYSPFRGLKGTVRMVDEILNSDEPFCFYLVALEGALIKEPVWFQSEEVESVFPQGSG
jgi:hypothetical protein